MSEHHTQFKESSNNTEHEHLSVRKTKNICSNCEDYVSRNTEKSYAVISCEGACLRGEISRRIANRICHALSPDTTVRICQGSAVTKDGGQRALVLNAEKVFFLEGCFVKCASRLMDSFQFKTKPEIILTDRHADFDKNLFGSNELTHEQIETITEKAALIVYEQFFKKKENEK